MGNYCVGLETEKLLEESRENLLDIGHGNNFFDMTPKSTGNGKHTKLKSFCIKQKKKLTK